MAKAATEKTLNLYQKLLEIQKRIIGLGKDGKSFGYNYVTGTKVLEYLKPLMNEYGLILKQEVLSIENTRQDYKAKSGDKSEILTKAMMRFTWIDCETGERDENSFGANGQNDWEKGLGSSLTYAERLFLLKYFHIATDEDDIDNPERKPQETAAQPKPAPVATKLQTEEEVKQGVSDKIEPAPAPDPNKKYATAKQKEEIIRLLNNTMIRREEKTKYLLVINQLDVERAAKAIEWCKKTIEDREAEAQKSA